MKRYLPLLIIVGVLAIALGAGVTMWRSAKQPPAQPAGGLLQPTPSTVASEPNPPGQSPNQIPVSQPLPPGSDNEHSRGNAKAKVTLEEYGDYQCPPCGALFYELKTIEKDYGDQLRFVFHHFPLQQVHKHAALAAHAAEAAGQQGRFWEMHDMIYQNQLSWAPAEDARPVFLKYAHDLNLDINRFTRDIDSPEVAARVTADYERGVALGVGGTPSIFINGRQVNPNVLTPEGLRMALDYVLGKKR
jgi:protein-disulfide isomerase